MKLLKKLAGIAYALLIVCACLFLLLSYLPGIEIYHVISNSMEPSIQTGSLILVKSVDPITLKTDDVITFKGGLSKTAVVTHRVVENQKENLKFITKGDANLQEDVLPVEYEEVIGKVILSIPYLGCLSTFISSPIIKVILIVGILLLFVVRKR